MKVYLVAMANDEYSDTLHLRDVLNSRGISPYYTLGSEKFTPRMFLTLEQAQQYLDSFRGKPEFSDGSGDIAEELSIFEAEYANTK